MQKLLLSFLFSLAFTLNPISIQVSYGADLPPCGAPLLPTAECVNPDGSVQNSDTSTVNEDDPSTGNEEDPSTGNEAIKQKICEEIVEEMGSIKAEEDASIVPCGRAVHQCEDATPGNEQCEFKHLFILVNNLVRAFIFIVFAPLLTLVLMYIGFLFIKEQAAAKAKAKTLLWRVLVGTFFVLASWLIVNLLLTALGADTILTKFFSDN